MPTNVQQDMMGGAQRPTPENNEQSMQRPTLDEETFEIRFDTQTDTSNDPRRRFTSDIEDERQVAQHVMKKARRDYDWRNKQRDFKRCRDLYERTQNLESDSDFPVLNMTRQAVEDYQAVALQNFPEARLEAVRKMGEFKNPVKRMLVDEALTETEKNMNAHVKNVKDKNDFPTHIEGAMMQAGIYGMGAVKIDCEKMPNARKDPRARRLLMTPMDEWTEVHEEMLRSVQTRLSVEQLHAPDVYFEEGRRQYEDCHRVSVIERASVTELRTEYDNDEIRPGVFPSYIEEDPANRGDLTARVTMWELEPVVVTKMLFNEETQEIERKVEFFSVQRVKTVIAGGQLVEREVTDATDGPVELPIVPIYMRTSEKHPYGVAIPEIMETSEEFVNLMRMIIYKSARNAASNQGILVATDRLTSGDRQRVEKVLSDGGLAEIEGNSEGPVDLSRIVLPLNRNQSQLSQSVVQAMQNEMDTVQRITSQLDQEGIKRAESAIAKRTQAQANDRPKGISVRHLGLASKRIVDRIYELVKIYRQGRQHVDATYPTGEYEIEVNKEVNVEVPYVDDRGRAYQSPELESPENPQGLLTEEVQMTLNDTSVDLVAKVNSTGALSSDANQRFNQVMMRMQSGLIIPETARELGLSDRVRALDDRNRQEEQQRQQEQMQQQQQQMQQQQQVQGEAPPEAEMGTPAGQVDPSLGLNEAPTDDQTMDRMMREGG